MDVRRESEPTPTKNRTTVERKSERELVVTRIINGPARLVFEAWTKPELFRKWWVPKSMGMTLRSLEMDARTGGSYRLDFGDGMTSSARISKSRRIRASSGQTRKAATTDPSRPSHSRRKAARRCSS